MITAHEALRQLAEVCKLVNFADCAESPELWHKLNAAQQVAEEVLKRPEQEPVAWGILNDTCPELTNDQGLGDYWARKGRKVTPLYAAPSVASGAQDAEADLKMIEAITNDLEQSINFVQVSEEEFQYASAGDAHQAQAVQELRSAVIGIRAILANSAPNKALVEALKELCDLVRLEVGDGVHTEEYRRGCAALNAAGVEGV